MLPISSPSSAPSTTPGSVPPASGRPRPWAQWAARLENEPHLLTAGDLARAAWETATNTTDRYLAALVAEALGTPVRPGVPPPHISKRRAQQHPNRPSTGWDRVLWVLENHLPGRLRGFSGACCLAALAAGAPPKVWNLLLNNGWVAPTQNILCAQLFSHGEEAVAERAWWGADERYKCLLRSPSNLTRPYAIETIFDAVALWGPLDRLDNLLVREDVANPGLAKQYERAVFLNAAAPVARQERLRAQWLAAVAREDADLARGPNPSGFPPWWFLHGLNDFLEQGSLPLPEAAVAPSRSLVRHALDMLVHLASVRLGLTSWLEARSPDEGGKASPGASPVSDSVAHPPWVPLCPTRMTVLQDECDRLTLVPTQRALDDPAGFAAALDLANKRALRPPEAILLNRRSMTSLPMLNTVWAEVCKSLCAPDDQSAVWSAYRFQDVCSILEGDAPQDSETPKISVGLPPLRRQPAPNAHVQSLLGWGLSLSLSAPPVVRVLLGARFGLLITKYNPGLLSLWANRVERDVDTLVAAGAPIQPWTPATPFTGTVLKDHTLLCLSASAADVEKMVDPSAEDAPPTPPRRRARLI